MLGVHTYLVFTIQVVDCITNALEMPRIKLLWLYTNQQFHGTIPENACT